MKRALSMLLLTGGILILSAPSFAQNTAEKKPVPAAEMYNKVNKITYDDADTVEGEFYRPGNEVVTGSKRAKHPSLIQLRPTFIPEMLKSALEI